MNREAWLTKAVTKLTKLLAAADAPKFKPPYISVGLPSERALARKQPTIGECWSEKGTKTGRCTVFISPRVENPKEILEIVLHELIHVVIGPERGHDINFQGLAARAGFTSPWREINTTQELDERLAFIAKRLPEYPHEALKVTRKKDKTRLVKYICDRCGQILRIDGPVGTIRCQSTTRDDDGKPTLEKPRRCGGTFIVAPVKTKQKRRAAVRKKKAVKK